MSTRAKIHDTLERLERWLREHQPVFLAAMRPGATDTELDDLERAIGRQLPDDVRAFYRWRGGIAKADHLGPDGWYEGPDGPFWGRPMTLSEIRSEYEECCGYWERDWQNLARGSESAPKPGWWHPAWVPIFDVNFGPQLLCVDTAGVWTGVLGQVIYFDNKSDPRTIDAASLGDLLRAFTRSLERKRTFEDTTDPGTLLDDARSTSPVGYPQYRNATEEPTIPEVQQNAPVVTTRPAPGAFRVGDTVRLLEGAFHESEGKIKRLEAGSWRVTVTLIFWGRPLDIEAEYWQIQLVEKTEQEPSVGEWNELTEGTELFAHLGFGPSIRKLRLFVTACYRIIYLRDWPEAAEPLCNALEEMANGHRNFTALHDALDDLWQSIRINSDHRPIVLKNLLASCPPPLGHGEPLEAHAPRERGATDLIREIFPNPFAPPRFAPAWRTADVVALARGIYDDRAFERMPILADALQEAGCDNADILTHCRGANHVHVRGCWALDLCLGLE